MSVDWNKPLESPLGNRENIEVLRILKDGDAIIYWTMGDNEYCDKFSPLSIVWRNVPELSARDVSLLEEGFAAGRDIHLSRDLLPQQWISFNADDLARKHPPVVIEDAALLMRKAFTAGGHYTGYFHNWFKEYGSKLLNDYER